MGVKACVPTAAPVLPSAAEEDDQPGSFEGNARMAAAGHSPALRPYNDPRTGVANDLYDMRSHYL